MIAEKLESPSPSIATAIIIKCQNRNDPYFDFDEYDELSIAISKLINKPKVKI